jgi:hypothetical protein
LIRESLAGFFEILKRGGLESLRDSGALYRMVQGGANCGFEGEESLANQARTSLLQGRRVRDFGGHLALQE